MPGRRPLCHAQASPPPLPRSLPMRDLEERMRAREWFHSLTLLPGAWAVVRVDGRSFSRYTRTRFDKPFDPRFSTLMVEAATVLLTELDGRYAYTESDEISVVLDPSFD